MIHNGPSFAQSSLSPANNQVRDNRMSKRARRDCEVGEGGRVSKVKLKDILSPMHEQVKNVNFCQILSQFLSD